MKTRKLEHPERRRSQEERSSTTKRRLMESALELLCQKGYANLTIQDVARNIGVSRGAPVHHFPNKPILVMAIVEYSCQLAENSASTLARKINTADDPLDAFVDGMAEYFFSPIFIGQLEILIAARTDSKIGLVMRTRLAQYRAAVEVIWIDALRRSGFSNEHAFWIFQLTLNILRGMGLHNAWRPEPDLARKSVLVWKAVLHELVGKRAPSVFGAGV